MNIEELKKSNHKRVYLASPYFYGDQGRNVRRQMDAANLLLNHGFVPFIPLLAHFQHLVHPRTEEEWLEWDLEWLKMCDIVIRFRPLDENGIEMPSTGADLEEKTAIENDIPVWTFQDIEDFENFLGGLMIKKAMKAASKSSSEA